MLNIKDIKELIKTIDASKVDEFTYEANGTLITLKKSKDIQQVDTENATTVQDEPERNLPVEEIIAEPVVEKNEAQELSTAEQSVDFDYEIVSPMVGTLYHASSPESDPYVSVGSSVTNDSIVCIVEAMKLFNEIEAEVSGEIVEILVEDGELVEFGQPLFRVKTK